MEGTPEAQESQQTIRECRIQVTNLKLDKNEQVKIMAELFAELPVSKYGQGDNSSSDETIIY